MSKTLELLKEGESEKVEFKPSLSQIDKIIESISAFSNTKGGRRRDIETHWQGKKGFKVRVEMTGLMQK